MKIFGRKAPRDSLIVGSTARNYRTSHTRSRIRAVIQDLRIYMNLLILISISLYTPELIHLPSTISQSLSLEHARLHATASPPSPASPSFPAKRPFVLAGTVTAVPFLLEIV